MREGGETLGGVVCVGIVCAAKKSSSRACALVAAQTTQPAIKVKWCT